MKTRFIWISKINKDSAKKTPLYDIIILYGLEVSIIKCNINIVKFPKSIKTFKRL